MKWIVGIIIALVVVVGAILIVRSGQIHADTTTSASAAPSVTLTATSTPSSSVDVNPPAPPTVSSL